MKVNRRRMTAGLVVLAMAALAACSSSTSGSASDKTVTTPTSGSTPSFPSDSMMAKIQAKGSILVGVKTQTPLFGQKDPRNGQLEGFDIEIAKAISKHLFGADGHVKFVEAPTPTREQLIMQDKVDMVIATYTITAAREQKVSFAGPYYNVHNAMLVKAGNSTFGKSFAGFQSLVGHKICAPTNGASYNAIQAQAPGVELSGYDQEDKCVAAVEQGRAEGYVADDAILYAFLKESPGKYEVVANSAATPEPYGIGVKKDGGQFCGWINDQLKDMFTNGEWEAAFKSSLGEVVKDVPATPESGTLTHC